MEKLELKKMQELLVDYVLNRISDDDRKLFEANIEYYPELKEELIQSEKLFSRIEQTDFDKITSGRTRNTTYKVKQKYKLSPTKSERRIRFATKIVFPTFGLLAIVFLMFTTVDFSGFLNFKPKPVIPDNLLSDVNLEDYNENIIESDLYSFNTSIIPTNTLDSIYADYEMEYITEFESDIDVSQANNLYISNNIYDYNNLDENEFQEIYEEIKNETFEF
jgi:hypothetical protein